jgi:hypothetical protein
VDYAAVSRSAFLDELEKIAVSSGRLRDVTKGRSGTRSISVERLLEKDKDGTLFKKHAEDWVSSPVEVGLGGNDPASARKPRRKGEVPTQDDVNVVDRVDTRDNTTTTTGLGSTFNNIGATGNSAGGT